MLTVVAPVGPVAPCVVLKRYVPPEFDVRLTVSPTVVSVPLAVSSVTVNGPNDAVADAPPDAGPVSTSLVGPEVMDSCWVPDASPDAAAVMVGVPTFESA